MKTIKKTLIVALAIIIAVGITSCFNNSSEINEDSSVTTTPTVSQTTSQTTTTQKPPIPDQVSIVEIKLSNTKDTFEFAEDFSYGDLVVTAIMSDNTEKVLSSTEYTVKCEDYNSMKVGTYEV